MSPRRRSSLPRPLAPLEAPAVYRAGMYAELQKFGDSSRDAQLSLWQDQEEPGEITVSGLNLSESEDRAFSAIQKLLDETDYRGNLPARQADSPAFKWTGSLPSLAISHSQYFEAYGLQKQGDGSYYGHQAEEALQALQSLSTTRSTVYYERKRYTGTGKKARQVSDIIRAKAPVIILTEITAYEDLEPEEAEEIKAGQQVAEGKIRATGLLIEPSPLLMDGIEDFFLLKPSSLHQEIKHLLGPKRSSRANSLFIEWLLTKNTAIVKISKAKLIQKLRLSSYIQRRHKEEAEARLQEAIQTAKSLGYLLEAEDSGAGILTFRLSPERCSRVKQGEEEVEQ